MSQNKEMLFKDRGTASPLKEHFVSDVLNLALEH